MQGYKKQRRTIWIDAPLITTQRNCAMTAQPLPSPELLRKLLRHEPLTGNMFWRERDAVLFSGNDASGRLVAAARWNARFAGKQAFAAKNGSGYFVGAIFGRAYRAHRVIWAMETGEWPVDQIDHEDHNRANNKFKNLRQATNKQNGRNQSIPSSNTSGAIGVAWCKRDDKWKARIYVNGTEKFLGRFKHKSDAIASRLAANIKYNFHENHGRCAIKH